MQLPKLLALPPHHLVHDARVGLDDLHDLGGHVLVGVVGHGRLGERPLRVQRHGGAHGVHQAALVDAGEREVRLVERLGALGGGADDAMNSGGRSASHSPRAP